MKALFQTIILVFIALSSESALALEPVSVKGEVLGLPGGVYEGTGTLVSQSLIVPNTQFHSVRRIDIDVIVARTRATLFGLEVGSAAARLKVVPVNASEFKLLDLDAGGIQCGRGFCSASSCSFQATVMQGALTLNEEWTPTDKGFFVEGSQVFNGNTAVYSAQFNLKSP